MDQYREADRHIRAWDASFKNNIKNFKRMGYSEEEAKVKAKIHTEKHYGKRIK